jgi:hypothetical protein
LFYNTLDDHIRNAAFEMEADEVANKREVLLSIPGISPTAVDILLRTPAFSGERDANYDNNLYDSLKKELIIIIRRRDAEV